MKMLNLQDDVRELFLEAQTPVMDAARAAFFRFFAPAWKSIHNNAGYSKTYRGTKRLSKDWREQEAARARDYRRRVARRMYWRAWKQKARAKLPIETRRELWRLEKQKARAA